MSQSFSLSLFKYERFIIFVSVIVKGMAKRTMFLSVIKFYNSICLERSQKQLCPGSKGLTTISQICSPHHSLFAFLQLHYFSVQFQSISVGATTSTDPKYVCFPLSITYISLIFPFQYFLQMNQNLQNPVIDIL